MCSQERSPRLDTAMEGDHETQVVKGDGLDTPELDKKDIVKRDHPSINEEDGRKKDTEETGEPIKRRAAETEHPEMNRPEGSLGFLDKKFVRRPYWHLGPEQSQ